MAKKIMEHKCRYAHCLHDSKEIAPNDEVAEGSAYYHKDCYRQMKQIKEIINVWTTQINKNVVFAQLRKIINILVYDRSIDAGYLLFAVRRGAQEKWLHQPSGLYYVASDDKLIAEWRKIEAKRKIEGSTEPKIKADNIYSSTPEDLGYTANKRKRGFGGILVG